MKAKSIVQLVIMFGLAFLLMWWAMRNIDLADLQAKIKETNINYILLVCVIGVVATIIRALRWQIVIEPLGVKPSFINTTFSVFIGYGVNFFTARLGEVAKCGILAKYENVPADKLAGTIVAERIFDLIGLAVVLLLSIVVEYTLIKDFMLQKIVQPLELKYGSNIWIIASIILIIGIVIGVIVIRKILNNTSENKLMKIIRNLSEGFVSATKIKNFSLFLLYSISLWACYWAATYYSFFAFAHLSDLTPSSALTVLSFGSFGMIATPGGTGAFQALVQSILVDIYHKDATISMAYALISWALQNGILIVGAIISMLLFPIVNRKKILD